MGWAHFKLPDGREAGYAVETTCEHPGCKEKIDRGLSYVCGGMHEGGELGCGHYFCAKHLTTAMNERKDTFIEHGGQLCEECCDEAEQPFRLAEGEEPEESDDIERELPVDDDEEDGE